MVVLFCCVAFVLRSFFCDWRAIGVGVCTTLRAAGWCVGQLALDLLGFWVLGFCVLNFYTHCYQYGEGCAIYPLLSVWRGLYLLYPLLSVWRGLLQCMGVFVASGYLEKQKTTKVAAYSIDSCGVRNLIQNVRHCGLLII